MKRQLAAPPGNGVGRRLEMKDVSVVRVNEENRYRV